MSKRPDDSHITLGNFPSFIKRQTDKLVKRVKGMPTDKYGRAISYVIPMGFGPNRAQRQAAIHANKKGSNKRRQQSNASVVEHKNEKIMRGRDKIGKLLRRADIDTEL